MSSWTSVKLLCCEPRTYTPSCDTSTDSYTLILNGLEIQNQGFPAVYIPKPFSVKQVGNLFTLTPNIGEPITIDYQKVTFKGTLIEFRDQLGEWACSDCSSTDNDGYLSGPIIVENWVGGETAITIPIPPAGWEVDTNSIQLFANGALQAIGYSAPFSFGFTILVNGDGSVTVTPSESWGDPDTPSRMIVYYSIKTI